MGTNTGAGAKLAIASAAPATFDAAGYAALTFTDIGQIEKIGTIGAQFNKVEFQPLNGPKQKLKGSADYGTLAPSLALDSADAGQTLLRAAALSSNNYSYKVTMPDGTFRYFRGTCFGMPENIDGADSVVMANPTIEINTTIIVV